MSRVVIIDDHPGFREHLAAFIGQQPGCSVAGIAGDTITGLRLVRDTDPDLVLIDVGLPDENGLRLATRLLSLDLGLQVALMGENDTAEYELAVRRTGATAFIPKTAISALVPPLLRSARRRWAPIPTDLQADDGLMKSVAVGGWTAGAVGLSWPMPRYAEWVAALALAALSAGIALDRDSALLGGLLGFLFLSYRQVTLPRFNRGRGEAREPRRALRAR